ncbi:MAG: lamin tail domain-containing protein [Verrucomicrobiales bacterium]
MFARFGDTTLRFCKIHPQFRRRGEHQEQVSVVEDSTFLGNGFVDTEDRFRWRGRRRHPAQPDLCLRGPNSDGIDVGEGCADLLVAENRIYNNSDKGVSVGQGSAITLYRNLIVGCDLGIGIKDTGSTAAIDQNTFVGNRVAVAVYEKNLGAGGGSAAITNTLFSRSKDADVTADSLSSATVSYSLSDTLPLAGAGNFVAAPAFADPGAYDFSLQPGSPAIDAGDPAHALDGDGSRADIGAYYAYDPADYPFQVPNVVVINEVLAHSSDLAPDWIELYNSSANPVDVGGWFVSDSGSDLEKYRIADGTTIAGHGYLVLYEDQHFGASSADPGALTPFALSENGETVYLHAPGDGLVLGYDEEETFGPSATDVTVGRYFKASTNTFNFVAMAQPTPGAANSLPLVGPIVISEIMYHPDNGDAEYLELTNISGAAVTLYDELKAEPWRFTDGIDFAFPTAQPVSLLPGERLILTRNLAAFQSQFAAPAGTQILQGTGGGLSNSGEKLELSSPGDVDGSGARQFIRVDRVNYEDAAPWPAEADGGGYALTRIDNAAYGNDPANWIAALPAPGETDPEPAGFDAWALDHQLPEGESGEADNPDGDSMTNFEEYARGTDPMIVDLPPSPLITVAADGTATVRFAIAQREDLAFAIQASDSMLPGSWTDQAARSIR